MICALDLSHVEFIFFATDNVIAFTNAPDYSITFTDALESTKQLWTL